MALEVEAVRERGRAAWPDLDVSPATLVEYLAERPDAQLEQAADLYLACACLANDARAIAAFDRRFDVAQLIGSLARDPKIQINEIRQTLAIKLLVGDGETGPRLARYTGRGSLEGWVRVATTRIALDAARRAPRDQPASDEDGVERLAEAASVELDGDLLLLRERYVVEFRASLQEALRELEAHHRALLRLHYLEGVTTAALAKLYQTSRNTVVRRIADARAALFEGTIGKLTARVGLPPDQYRTLLQLVRSQMDISIAQLLER